MIQFQGHRVSRLTNRIRPKNESEAPVNNVNFSYNNICWVEKVWIVWPHCLDMMCVVVSCCEKFACDKNVYTTNVVRQNISLVFSDDVCCSSRLTALQTLLSSRVREVWQNVRRVWSLHIRTTCNKWWPNVVYYWVKSLDRLFVVCYQKLWSFHLLFCKIFISFEKADTWIYQLHSVHSFRHQNN